MLSHFSLNSIRARLTLSFSLATAALRRATVEPVVQLLASLSITKPGSGSSVPDGARDLDFGLGGGGGPH